MLVINYDWVNYFRAAPFATLRTIQFYDLRMKYDLGLSDARDQKFPFLEIFTIKHNPTSG